jgi:hypothetical protein
MNNEIAHSNDAARLAVDLENQLDVALVKLARVEQANDETVPLAVVRRLSDGEVPVMVWREHRGLSREQLATAANIQTEFLAVVEKGKAIIPLDY